MIYTKDNPKLVDDYFNFPGKENFTGVVKDKKNTISYYLNGRFHRKDGPSITYDNYHQAWYLNGKYHREDGPAVEWGKAREWWLNGKLHREDGPAYEQNEGGTKRWYIHGKLHREDGPAIEDGFFKEWYLNDICYGWNDAFTNESWTRFVKLELLK